MNYYKRHIGDYHKKAGRLSLLQHGVYTVLMDAIYDREKFPTRSEAIEWCWAATPDEIAAVELILSKFFTNGNGIYKQKRIEEELNAYRIRSEKNKRIAIDRETKRAEKRTNGDESPPNHKPLTTNHNNINIPTVCVENAQRSPPIPYQKIVDLYHEHLPKLPKVVKLTKKRQTAIRNLWNADAGDLDFWKDYFSHAAKSRFLHGQNDRGWRADFDFFLREQTMVKMQEGKYHG